MTSSIYAGEKTIHPFDHIFVIMMENATRGDVLDNAYMRNLCNKGVYLKNSYGVTHSSQPNYIASVGGDNFGIANDNPTYAQWVYNTTPDQYEVSSIADLLEAKGFTWKAYAEDLPDTYVQEAVSGFPNSIPPDVGNFARKHVPFLSFANIINNPERAANIVNATQLQIDLQTFKLPNFSWYTPNLINDGHDLKPNQTPKEDGADRKMRMENIADFLKGFWGDDPIAKFPPKTLIILTFDEAYPYNDPYEIYTVLMGDGLHAPGTRSEPYNHYSMLRSVEVNFGLGTLQRNDAVAYPYWFLRES